MRFSNCGMKIIFWWFNVSKFQTLLVARASQLATYVWMFLSLRPTTRKRKVGAQKSLHRHISSGQRQYHVGVNMCSKRVTTTCKIQRYISCTLNFLCFFECKNSEHLKDFSLCQRGKSLLIRKERIMMTPVFLFRPKHPLSHPQKHLVAL